LPQISSLLNRSSQPNFLAHLYGLVIACAGMIMYVGERTAAAQNDPTRAVQTLGRGMNLGNALEAPREGEWGVMLQADYFRRIKDAGFDSVRIPIRWSAHADAQPPYSVDLAFFRRIDWIVNQALTRGLAVVIDDHHDLELAAHPTEQLPRLKALWTQIATHYRNYPDKLFFELLNEPNSQLTDEVWNQTIPELLHVVRQTNPVRMVIVGPGHWNAPTSLDALTLPERDAHLIVTFHYYSPFPFTHQGASWIPGSQAWLGTQWQGTPQEKQAIDADFSKVAHWARQRKRLVYLGEFGAFGKADIGSRERWTRAVAREAEKYGFAWAYWEFCSSFGAYDLGARAWRQPLLRALTER
jgi:endoglucanase